MNNFKQIIINKNRGWRGLAEAVVTNEEGKIQMKNIFSFSEPVWRDLIDDQMLVLRDKDFYYVLTLEESSKLPRPEQQRSVLIKNAAMEIKNVNKYSQEKWNSASGKDWSLLYHFVKNRNNHTTSDWNCIGIRVKPEI